VSSRVLKNRVVSRLWEIVTPTSNFFTANTLTPTAFAAIIFSVVLSPSDGAAEAVIEKETATVTVVAVVGAIEGAAVGQKEGLGLLGTGIMIGLGNGNGVGNIVGPGVTGIRVGFGVGICEGEGEGSAEGIRVGFGVGVREGEGEGSDEGRELGA